MELLLFLIIITLLFIHEMDAIRAKEWKMFIILKDMKEEKAYWVFTLIHLPLYLLILYILTDGGHVTTNWLQIIVDIFLIFHAVIHVCFRKHKDNRFQSVLSKWIIYFMAIMAFLHLLFRFLL